MTNEIHVYNEKDKTLFETAFGSQIKKNYFALQMKLLSCISYVLLPFSRLL